MTEVLEFIVSWWGLLALVIIFALKLIFDYEATLKRIRELIYLAEEHAKKEALKTGKEKFEWVKSEGYKYLPATLKLFVSQELFGVLVQSVFDRLVQWAEQQELR